ncbi:MAG TPA: murein biosynthesis integral membrane protein MurJ [Candidatus Omnitrophota bacterium]|nr:murein biosynthesis integral membrane protein MurJ [Candidatus Omnitrophota bacterium]
MVIYGLMTNRKLLKSTGVISFATVTSRILGFVRDILIAGRFGTGIFADAFFVAFRIPNMLRDMVGEGAMTAAIVPVLTEYRHTRTNEEYWEVARVILNLMLMVLVALSLAGVFFAPVVVRLIAPGFSEDPDKFRTTVTLTRLIFPYLLLIGMVAYSKGVLNSLHYFTSPEFAPVVLNVTLIVSLLILCPVIGINGLVAGVLAGGVLEVMLQVLPLKNRGFRFGGKFTLAHPVAKRIGRLLLPRAMGTAVYQLSIFVDTVLASLGWIVGPGGVAALYYSNRLVQLPLAVFGVSLATAALPKMTKEVALNDMAQLKSTIYFSLRTVFTIMMPAAAGLAILSKDIIRTLFERGQFTEYSTGITSYALFFYSFGLCGYAGIKILVGVYYAMGDTKTPVKTASAGLLVNLLLNLALMWPLKVGGLALATSVAATLNFIMLYALLSKKIGELGTKRLLVSFIKISIATVIMGIFTFMLASKLLDKTYGSVECFIRLMGIIAISGAIYAFSCYFLRLEGVKSLFSRIKRA